MKAFDLLIDDLKNNDWYIGSSGCTLNNKRNNVSVWIANIPVFDTNVSDPAPMSLSFIQKWKLYKAVKVAINNAVVKELQRANRPIK
jgi:hypothetical protein